MTLRPIDPIPTGKLGFGAQQKMGWGDRLGLLGATLQDTAAGLNGQHLGAVQALQGNMQSRQQNAARQTAYQHLGGSISDPQEAAVFAADPETWLKLYGERMKPQTLSEGQAVYVGDKQIAARGKTGISDGFAYSTDGATGQLSFGAQRPKNYNEVRADQQDDPNVVGSEAWNRVQGNQVALGNLDVSRGQLGVSRGQLGVAQGNLSLGKQRLGLELGGGAPPSGYRRTADGGLEFIPGGPADPNSAKRAAPTEDQAKTEFNLSRMRNASTDINKLETQGYNRAGAFAVPGFVPSAAGDNKRLYDSRAEEWADGIIRLTTGAAATKQEIASAKKQYFPQIGDSPAVIANKAAARAAAERAAGTRAGPAEGRAATSAPAASSGWKIVR